jgi:type III pantothenate kinase
MNFCAIDFGHTNYKLALIQDGNIFSVQKNSYENISELNNLSAIVKKFNCEKVFCCNVLKETDLQLIMNELPSDLKEIIKFINSEDCNKHISLAYKNNLNNLGVDRALNLVGASVKTNKDIIVIDAGTATTIDYLDSSKNHIGGIILPSKELIDSIFMEMLDFDFSNDELTEGIFSSNTRSSIENGSTISAYHSINNILDKMIESRNITPDIFVTGGNSKCILDNCNYPIIHVESLLFEGILVFVE